MLLIPKTINDNTLGKTSLLKSCTTPSIKVIFILLIITAICTIAQPQQKSKTAEEWIELGDKDFRNRDYQQAISKYTSALEVERENKRAYLKRAETYQLLKKFKFALSDVDSLINIQSDHTQALSMKGQLALSLGLFDQSVSAFNSLLKLKPSDDTKEKLKKALLGKSLYSEIVKNPESSDIQEKFDLNSNENSKRCVQVITKLLSEEVGARESVDLIIERAHCSLRSKLLQLLMQDIKTIYAKDNTNVQATILYSKYLYLLGDIETAKNTIKTKCLRVDPENRNCKELFKLFKQAERLNEQANNDFNSGNHNSAIKHFKEYIELMENDAKSILPGVDMIDVKVKTCQSYGEAQDHTNADEGIKLCTSVIDSLGNSDNSEYKMACLISRAQLHVTLDDFDKAKADANQVRESEHANKHQQKLQQILGRIQQQERINSQRDHYKALGFDRKNKDQVTLSDIKKAYRKLVKIYHPDKHKTQADKDKAAKKYKEITEAYEVLSDDSKRQRYDAGENDFQHGDQGGHHGGFQHGNPFGSFFQEGGGFRFHFG
ncbi:HSP70 family protein [Naegleria gruberi]|uniref:HSP70 family protein n=1 Tax=Naegleria gruberi TaxID=5762 RepID=D2V5T2_NAEGR|nr:HSP70 family protein [Naegleria gruberi]EFC47849.1 HSP70 family protein [Naegleria gruberi]|eukprot:XP_002680593.1 HSP70 family protein [Naegleria gruberi strain NEG-M]